MVDWQEEKEKWIERIRKFTVINEKGCWIWTGAKHKYGYGKTSCLIYGKRIHISAHRLSWSVYRGKIPTNMCVCHNCPNGDNPSCCNPDHLFLGTAKDNTRDMMSKKTVFDFVGEKNNKAILTESIVIQIRSLKESGMKVCDIARKLNLKYFTCLDVVNRRNWSHI